jgi:hypothetical protein
MGMKDKTSCIRSGILEDILLFEDFNGTRKVVMSGGSGGSDVELFNLVVDLMILEFDDIVMTKI